MFGAVERDVWMPLSALWLGLGVAVAAAAHGRRGLATTARSAFTALLPLHAFFLVQLVPLNAAFLHAVSPGSFAAHFLPDPGGGSFRPVSVSPSATGEAWLYFAGLQGLFVALLGVPRTRRRLAGLIVFGAILVLAAEGLWQSRSPHPTWLYGRMPNPAPVGLDNATFGPYFNRNHFATLMAVGAGWAAGLALALVRERGALTRLLGDPTAMSRTILLGGACLLLIMASAASGSRSGSLAAVVAVGVTLARAVSARLLLVPFALSLLGLALAGPAVFERLMNVDIVASRFAPWKDMTRLFDFFPVFGSGLGTFHAAYWPYQMNASYEFWVHAHNEYLQWVIETGAAGTILALVVMWTLSRSLKCIDSLREATAGAGIAFLTQAALDFPFRIPANAAVLICLVALAQESETSRAS